MSVPPSASIVGKYREFSRSGLGFGMLGDAQMSNQATLICFSTIYALPLLHYCRTTSPTPTAAAIAAATATATAFAAPTTASTAAATANATDTINSSSNHHDTRL